MEYKGIGIRAVAQIIDGIIGSLIFLIVGFIVSPMFGGRTSTGFSLSGMPAIIMMLIAGLAVLGYFIVLEGMIGQTLGKKLTGIKVMKENGRPCDLGTALIRNILRIIDGLFFYIVGAIFIARSDKKQRLGDKVARTVVVKK